MRAIVANSGNANALVGPTASATCARSRAAVARRRSASARRVLSASTGRHRRAPAGAQARRGRPAAAASRGAAIELAAQAVMTTDTRVKLASRVLRVGRRRRDDRGVRKGSGMIAPELATMLAFITTDLAVDAAALQSRARERDENELQHDHRRRRHEHQRRRLRARQRPRRQRRRSREGTPEHALSPTRWRASASSWRARSPRTARARRSSSRCASRARPTRPWRATLARASRARTS
jgi:hypothetical protein